MKILIISNTCYSKTNKSIDIMNDYLAKYYDVDRLIFYKRNNNVKYTSNEFYFIDNIKLYRNIFKYFMPGEIIKFLFYIMYKSFKFNYKQYDYIIVESGYPIFLAIFLKNRIIYRQSDPTEMAFNTNRKYFKKIEKNIIRKSLFTISVLYKNDFYKEYLDKYIFWKTGYNISINDIKIKMDYNIKKENIITYMGNMPIDINFLNKLAPNLKEYDIYIIGNYKKKKNSHFNLKYTGYLNYTQYIDIIKKSKIFIIPVSNKYKKHSRFAGLTSKFYLPMQFGIPIVCKKYGYLNDDFEKKIYTYNKNKSGIIIIKNILKKIENNEINFSVNENTLIFLLNQSKESKYEELENIFNNIIFKSNVM